MKFQKILIGVYLLIQVVLSTFLMQMIQLNYLYFTLLSLSTFFFLSSHFRDPGYFYLEEDNQAHQPNNNPHFQDLNEMIQQDRELNHDKKILRSIISQPDQIWYKRSDHLINLDRKLAYLGFSKPSSKSRDKRYCGICMINQPYRTRHCHECQKCVSTFDHHCPWINNCVGQKNRQLLFTFLLFQTTQIFYAAVLVCSEVINRIIPITAEWILGSFLIILFSIFLGLTGFHLYLMVTNLTTWQLVKWDSIPYLSKLDRTKGSPFSKGLGRNLQQYWIWGFRKTRKIWQFQG